MKKRFYTAMLLIVLNIIGCQKESKEILLKVNSNDCVNIEATSVTIEVDYTSSKKLSFITVYYARDEVFVDLDKIKKWVYWPTGDQGSWSSMNLGAADHGKCSITLRNLLPNTKYHYFIEMETFEGESCYSTESLFSTIKIAYEAVDLGLSVKWGSCNIGAEKPEDFGYYYSWGETVPVGLGLEDRSNLSNHLYNQARGNDSYVKTEDIWETYKWCNGSEDSITKYCWNDFAGSGDGKKILEKDDDAASEQAGEKWRIPTWDEWKELKEKCIWSKVERNGIKGYIIRNNNAWIFLPYYNTGSCQYWSSTIYDESTPRYYGMFAYNYWIDSAGNEVLQYCSRQTCELIRPVQSY